MTVLEWTGIGSVMCVVLGSGYFVIMVSVDDKIEKAMNKLKDDKIQELQRERELLIAKNEMLKDGLSRLK